MNKNTGTKKAPLDKRTEPKEHSNQLSAKNKRSSTDFLYFGEKAVAYFEGKVCWYRPGLSTIEQGKVQLEAQKRECAVIHKCPDETEFENAESGTEKLEKAMGLENLPVYHHVEILSDLLKGHDDLFELHKGHYIAGGALCVVTYKPDGHVYEIKVERVKVVQ